MLLQEMTAIGKSARTFIDDHAKAFNISNAEKDACTYIHFHASPNQEDIAKALGMDKGNAAKMMLQMENSGLILRSINPKNRREYIISLTPSGQEIIDAILKASASWQEVVLKDFSTEEQQLFLSMLKKVRINAHDIMRQGLGEDSEAAV